MGFWVTVRGTSLDRVIITISSLLNNYDNHLDITVIVPSTDVAWTLFEGDGGTRSWLRNSPSCSSAISVLTLRERKPGFMSSRLMSPDRSRLRATSAKHMSYSGEHVSHTRSATGFFISVAIIELTSWLLLSTLLLSCPTEKSHANLQEMWKKDGVARSLFWRFFQMFKLNH